MQTMNHNIKHFHSYYHRKLGKGEARSRTGFLEEGTLTDWVAFRKIEVRGIWNHSDIYSYLFAEFLICKASQKMHTDAKLWKE